MFLVLRGGSENSKFSQFQIFTKFTAAWTGELKILIRQIVKLHLNLQTQRHNKSKNPQLAYTRGDCPTCLKFGH